MSTHQSNETVHPTPQMFTQQFWHTIVWIAVFEVLILTNGCFDQMMLRVRGTQPCSWQFPAHCEP